MFVCCLVFVYVVLVVGWLGIVCCSFCLLIVDCIVLVCCDCVCCGLGGWCFV